MIIVYPEWHLRDVRVAVPSPRERAPNMRRSSHKKRANDNWENTWCYLPHQHATGSRQSTTKGRKTLRFLALKPRPGAGNRACMFWSLRTLSMLTGMWDSAGFRVSCVHGLFRFLLSLRGLLSPICCSNGCAGDSSIHDKVFHLSLSDFLRVFWRQAFWTATVLSTSPSQQKSFSDPPKSLDSGGRAHHHMVQSAPSFLA